MNKGRTFLAFKNSVIAGFVTLLNFPIQFINRFFMIRYLGITYLGLTSLYANIIGVLSLADLGIGTAIVFMLYKPLGEQDAEKISVLMKYYRNIYRCIALIILVLGICVIPFLKFFIGKSIDYPHVYLLFIIYLLGAVSSYFFSYNQSLLYADQRNNIVSWINLIVNYIMLTIQIMTVLFFKDPLLYAILFVFSNFITNIFLSIYVRKNYSIKPTKKSLDKSEKKLLLQNVVGNGFLRISGVIVTGTDSILLSAFAGIIQVGIYANYVTIVNVIQRFMIQVIGAITGSIGNFITNKNSRDGKILFYNLQFINFILVNIACLGIYFLINDVVLLWIGKKYILCNLNVFLIAISFYFMNYRMLGWNFVSVYGLSRYMKIFSINEIIANVALSLIFLVIFKLRLTGILLGNIFSTLFTVMWQDPYIIFKKGFHTTTKKYFKRYIYNLFILGLEFIVISFLAVLSEKLLTDPITRLIIMGIIIIIVGSVMPISFYLKTSEFRYLLTLIKKIKGEFN